MVIIMLLLLHLISSSFIILFLRAFQLNCLPFVSLKAISLLTTDLRSSMSHPDDNWNVKSMLVGWCSLPLYGQWAYGQFKSINYIIINDDKKMTGVYPTLDANVLCRIHIIMLQNPWHWAVSGQCGRGSRCNN